MNEYGRIHKDGSRSGGQPPRPQPDPLVEAWIEATGNTVGMEPLTDAIVAWALADIGRRLGAVLAGYAAFALSVGAGIPVWVDWPTWEVPADATDIGILVAAAAFWLSPSNRKDRTDGR